MRAGQEARVRDLVQQHAPAARLIRIGRAAIHPHDHGETRAKACRLWMDGRATSSSGHGVADGGMRWFPWCGWCRAVDGVAPVPCGARGQGAGGRAGRGRAAGPVGGHEPQDGEGADRPGMRAGRGQVAREGGRSTAVCDLLLMGRDGEGGACSDDSPPAPLHDLRRFIARQRRPRWHVPFSLLAGPPTSPAQVHACTPTHPPLHPYILTEPYLGLTPPPLFSLSVWLGVASTAARLLLLPRWPSSVSRAATATGRWRPPSCTPGSRHGHTDTDTTHLHTQAGGRSPPVPPLSPVCWCVVGV